MHIEPTQPVGGGSPREDCSTTPPASAVGFCMEVPQMEEWRAVVGYEGLYEVSDCGRVRSLRLRHGLGDRLRDKPLVLKQGVPRLPKGAYPHVSLCKNGTKTHRVHILVLSAFLGEGLRGYEGAHLDGDSLNCSANNLRWATRSENHLMKRGHGTSHAGERGPNAKLTWGQVDYIRECVVGGQSQVSVARRLGVCVQTICYIVNEQTWVPSLRPKEMERG